MSISAPTRQAKSTRMVLDALQQLNHATAPEILDWVNRVSEGRKVSLTSVYRALNQLVAEARIKPLNFNDGQVRYELNSRHMHHHHLICTRCDAIQVLDACPFEALLEQVAGQFKVHYHNFEVFGLCPSCAGDMA